jgi:hypothetical protein
MHNPEQLGQQETRRDATQSALRLFGSLLANIGRRSDQIECKRVMGHLSSNQKIFVRQRVRVAFNSIVASPQSHYEQSNGSSGHGSRSSGY